jgi:hypothetical protein
MPMSRTIATILALSLASGCAGLRARSDTREAASLMAYLDKPGVSTEQRSAALETFLEDHAGDAALPDADRWRAFLLHRLRSVPLGLDEGLRTGDLLQRVASVDALRELEAHYAAHRSELAVGNKIAIASAAQEGPSFGESVVSDASENIQVREAAFERLAKLGFLEQAQELALTLADPKLSGTAASVGARYAKDLATLHRVAELAERSPPQVDAHGRDSLGVTQVAISEASVSGKSDVMLGIWQRGTERLLAGAATEEDRGRTFVVSIATAHAIWSESDAAYVATFLESRWKPLLQTTLGRASDAKSADATQAVGEFSNAFRQECKSRPTKACTDPGDPRVLFVKQLLAILEPHVRGTELAFYLEPVL